ncbi:MAG: DUF2752 domain-containing protein [Planctomycetota bacterium]|nr:DUF2752 domain-containing protein [Planctomycetota bacterium]
MFKVRIVTQRPLLAIVWSLVGGLFLLGGALHEYVHFMMPSGCPFHALTGVPCPTCGSTRAVVSFSKLDFAASFTYNPAMFFLCILTVLMMLWTLWALLVRPFDLKIRANGVYSTLLRVFAILVLPLNWILVLYFHGALT